MSNPDDVQMDAKVKETLDRFFADTKIQEFFEKVPPMVSIEIGWEFKCILPKDEAIKMLEALSLAEFADWRGDSIEFKPESPDVKVRYINMVHYRRAKIAEQLGIDTSHVTAYVQQQDRVPF